MSKISIIYWTSTGNTEGMANAIAEGVKSAGAEVTLLNVNEASVSDVTDADKVILGCPSMGAEQLEEYEFRPFFDSIKDALSGKPVALFGSYDWGDGAWMRDWEQEVRDAGANLFESGYIHRLNIDGDEAEAAEFGKRFAAL